jgi:hypothetical protein
MAYALLARPRWQSYSTVTATAIVAQRYEMRHADGASLAMTTIFPIPATG